MLSRVIGIVLSEAVEVADGGLKALQSVRITVKTKIGAGSVREGGGSRDRGVSKKRGRV